MKWQRVGGGYELRTPMTVYRVQRRTLLSPRQKWDLDRNLGLRDRDGKRREAWVILVNGDPRRHSYSKATAFDDVHMLVTLTTREHTRQQVARRAGPRIGLSLSQSHAHLPPDPQESVISHREDLRALSEHLPELRRPRYGSRRRRRAR